MGKLVSLVGRHKPVIAADRKSSGGAQILMFTGIRYERGTPPTPTTRLDPSRPKRKRG